MGISYLHKNRAGKLSGIRYSLTMPSPEPYQAQSAGNAGKGLFARRDIADGDTIWEEERPFLAVLDSARLKEACSWCFNYGGERTDAGAKLKVCTGCKILRFCNVVSSTFSYALSILDLEQNVSVLA